MESYCPVCGDSTTPSDTISSNATNTGRFVKDQEFGKVFECFLKLFEVEDPPWFEKAFVFCSECSRQLTVVSELEKVMKEVERRLKESEKVVKDKLRSSESKFQSSGVYGRDQRYWRVRKQFLRKDRDADDSNSETLSAVTSPSTSPARPFEVYGPGPTSGPASVNVNDTGEEWVLPDLDEDPCDNEIQEDNQRRKRQRTCHQSPPKGAFTQLGTTVLPTTTLSLESEYNLEEFFQGESTNSSKNQTLLEESEENEVITGQEETQTKKENPKPELTPEEEEQKALAIARWLTPGRPEVFLHGIRVYKIGDGKQYKCSACDDIIPIRNRNQEKHLLYKHVVETHTDLFKCKDCGERFGSKRLLNIHEDRVHKGLPAKPVIKKYKKCHVCGKPVLDIKSHVWSHKNKNEKQAALARGEQLPKAYIKNFKCDECDKTFQGPKGLEKHRNYFHNSLKRKRKIENVDENTISIWDVALTKEVDTPNCYKCSKCDAILEKREVSKHVIREHTALHKCSEPGCEKRFHSSDLLQIHLKSAHKLGSLCPCPICERPFYGKKAPRRHIWTHFSDLDRQEALANGETVPFGVDRSFQCEKCPSSYTSNGALRSHQKQVHDGKKKRATCEICGVSVTGSLAGHVRSCHPNEEDFRFVCTVCNRRFAQYTRLKLHKQTCHVVEPQFKCEFCRRGFKLERNLKEHRLGVHLNQRPFKCKQCPMAFMRRSLLKRHVQGVHEGVKFKQYPRKKRRGKQKKEVVVEIETSSEEDEMENDSDC